MKVSTINLSPDLTAAGSSYGTIDRGERTREGLTILLNEFLALDATLAFMHDPQVIVQTLHASYAIRTDRGQLHLYNARDTSQPGVAMDLTTLLTAIDDAAPAPLESDPVDDTAPPAARSSWKQEGTLAAILLALGLGLNAWGAYQFVHHKPAAPERSYKVITDEANGAMLLKKLAGHYTTGSEPGGRTITLERDGTIRFGVLLRQADGAVRATHGAAEPCRFGLRSNGSVCLVTTRSGQIGVGRDGSLAHYGDTYRRITVLAE